MRLACAFALIACSVGWAADPAAVSLQKRTAEENCRTIQLGPVSMSESSHLVICGDASAARLKGMAANLEKQYATAAMALQIEKNDPPWTGKLTVYIIADRGQYRSFIRQVEKRSPDDGEPGSRVVSGETPHVAVAPPQGKDAPTPEVQAGYEVAIALLSVRAKGAPVPEWITQGFARATAGHAANSPASVRKRLPRQLAGRLKPAEVWNDMLSIEDRMPLASGMADYLFYGRGLPRPGDFLLAFRGNDDKPMKTLADALEAVKLTPEKLEAGYLAWLRTNN
jgi:hypothetical protein